MNQHPRHDFDSLTTVIDDGIAEVVQQARQHDAAAPGPTVDELLAAHPMQAALTGVAEHQPDLLTALAEAFEVPATLPAVRQYVRAQTLAYLPGQH